MSVATMKMTVADLREYLADLPEYAPVEVFLVESDDCAYPHVPDLSYERGILTISAWEPSEELS